MSKLLNSKFIWIFKHLIISFVIYNLSFIISSPARAQSLSLSIAPPVVEIMIKPGKTITQTIKIANGGESTIITPLLKEYTLNGLQDNPNFTRDTWIEILNRDLAFDKSFFLKTGEERQVVLKISPPKDSAEKDYFRVLLFTTKPVIPFDYSQSSISQSIGSLILINVTSSGMKNKAAEISAFQIPKIADSFSPLETRILLKNTGDTYFRPQGFITLKGLIGQTNFALNPNLFLPGETKLLTVDEVPYAKDNQTLSLSGFYLGKYTLTITFTLDEGTIKISQTKTFYAIPWKGMTIFLLMLFFWMIMKKRKRK